MKRILKYIFFLFASLMIGKFLFAYSYKDAISFHGTTQVNENTFSKVNSAEAILKTYYKNYFFVSESKRDVIEISETENDTEDYQVSSQSFNAPVNYLNFFSRILSGDCDIVEKNGLSSFKFMSYLSTIDSLHIIFCVYRI